MVILPGTLQITESVPSKENKSAVIHSSYFEEPNVLTNSSYDKLNSSSDLASNLTSCNLIDGSNDYTIDLVHKKKMVLMELKNNAPNTFSYLYNSSNDSTDGEGEPTKRETNSCNQNHIMNNKKKFPKIVQLGLNQYPLLKKSEKIDYSSISANILAVIQQKKGVKEENEKTKTEDVNLQNAPRASKLIRVNSSKNFKSIYNHKAAIEDTEKLSSSSSVALKTLKIDFKKDVSKSSRDHFYKSFSLLVKLGGRNMLDVSSKKTQSDNLWQVEYNELLWLEIRAWQYGHTIDEEDNRLQEERFKVDKVLDEVINFKFSAYESSYNNLTGQNEKNNSYISANQKLPVISQTNLDAGKDSQLNPNSTFVFPLHPDFFDKNRYIGAMKVVVELLKKVDNVEKLYPSRESLVNEHLKYKDVKFVRNYEALLFWRNINLDIFHTMYMLSRWINIDLEDELVWKDWFLHGLELAHFQVKHSFYNSKWCSGNLADVLKSSSASLLSDQNEVRKSRKGKNAHHSSIIQQTSTSRYRSFVETEMRTSGFFGLMRHVKNLLKSTFVKGQFIYSDQKNVNLTNNEIDVAFEKKEAGKILNIVDSLSVAPVDTESDFSMLSFGNGVQYVKACQEMCLPSFLDNYLFLTRVPIDIVHESVRFRIEYKPKVEPSYLSIRQLIHECKEVISGSVMSKHYYKSIIGPFLSEVSQTQVQLYNAKIQEFEADLKSMLNLYFDYLQHWIRLVHKMEKTSENLKNILDEEWNFTKEICTFVHGGESIAAYKFCVMVSDILKSSSQYLKDSIDSLFSKSKLQEENNNFRQTIAAVCFEYRSVINEVRARASKGLGFAKLLCKDLGIAAKYEVISSYEKCFSKLKSSNHMMIEHDFTTDFIIFAPATLANRKRQCKQMISLIRGFDDPDDRSWCMDGYIILIKSPTEKVFWKGKRTTLDTSIDLDLALSNIKVEGMILICSNSFHLNSQRKNVEKLLNECIKVTSEQTSSHNLIEKSLEDLNNSALRLANVIVSGIDDIGHNLDTYYSTEIDAADAIYLKKLCVGSMHLCFSLGFEYLREVVRLLTGHWRIELSKLFLRLSKIWIKFVMTKTERGRGTRPRWAAQGMEFLIAAIDPINLEQISGEEFQNLKSEMQACARHVIGTYATPMEPKIKESHSSNSFLNRSRSLTQSRKSLDTQTKGDKPDSNHKDSSHLQSHITHASSESSLSLEGNGSLVEESYEESVEDTKEIAVPVIVRVRNAIKEIEERRTAKLQHMGVIGSVTYKKPDLAVELMQLNFRRVHFKWQLGNKIGEGQFGKVFSCVNLDTGELMAMKQIRFNPNDYGTIQSIADEITNVQSVKHDSLVKYFGVEVHKDEMLIFMEYCEDGTIAEVAKLGLPESLIRVYTYQIIKAVDFLHKNGIIHRDIKGANIFLSSSGLIKIGDFGSAVKLKDAFETCQGEVFNTRGTAAFMAPEVITLDKGCGYGRAADIWSVGCVVIEMVTGKQPWSEYDNVYAIMYKVGGGQIPAIPDNLSEEGKHFLMCCFREQHHRWTSAMLEDHPFVKCC